MPVEATKLKIGFKLGILPTVLLAAAFPVLAQTTPGPNAIESRSAEIDGIKLHYLTAGRGPTVILLHGYTQTSRMWRPLIPKLAEKFTVIVPALPGIATSDVPKDGLDMKTAAIPIHALAKSLGSTKSRGSAHHITPMLAYAYASPFPPPLHPL